MSAKSGAPTRVSGPGAPMVERTPPVLPAASIVRGALSFPPMIMPKTMLTPTTARSATKLDFRFIVPTPYPNDRLSYSLVLRRQGPPAPFGKQVGKNRSKEADIDGLVENSFDSQRHRPLTHLVVEIR